MPGHLTMPKGIAGGMPLAALTGRADAMDAIHVGGLGGTYAGNPVACASRARGDRDDDRPTTWPRRPRGRGAVPPTARGPSRTSTASSATSGVAARCLAVEWLSDLERKTPDADLTGLDQQGLLMPRGLVTLTCGTFVNVFRLLLPPSAGDDLLSEGLDILEESLRRVRLSPLPSRFGAEHPEDLGRFRTHSCAWVAFCGLPCLRGRWLSVSPAGSVSPVTKGETRPSMSWPGLVSPEGGLASRRKSLILTHPRHLAQEVGRTSLRATSLRRHLATHSAGMLREGDPPDATAQRATSTRHRPTARPGPVRPGDAPPRGRTHQLHMRRMVSSDLSSSGSVRDDDPAAGQVCEVGQVGVVRRRGLVPREVGRVVPRRRYNDLRTSKGAGAPGGRSVDIRHPRPDATRRTELGSHPLMGMPRGSIAGTLWPTTGPADPPSRTHLRGPVRSSPCPSTGRPSSRSGSPRRQRAEVDAAPDARVVTSSIAVDSREKVRTSPG